MDKQEIIIRQSKWQLLIRIILFGYLTAQCLYAVIANDYNWASIIIGIVLLIICIYSIKELKDRTIEIKITTEGVDLRDKGFYSWSSLGAFSIEEDEGTAVLILTFKEQAEVRFCITNLEVKNKELTELMLIYGQPYGLYYKK